MEDILIKMKAVSQPIFLGFTHTNHPQSPGPNIASIVVKEYNHSFKLQLIILILYYFCTEFYIL